GNTIKFFNTGSAVAQTFNVIEYVSDASGATANSVNSIITVNPALAITLTPASNTITSGTSQYFTNTVTGGTVPYSAYSYSVFQYGAPAAGGNYVISQGNTIKFFNTAAAAQTFNVIEYVSDASGATA